MSQDFDGLIAEKQKELDSFKSKMEELRLLFIKDSTTFVSEWYKNTAEHFVITESDRTIALGETKVKEMKTKVLELIQNTDKIVNEILSNSNLWWHLSEFDGSMPFAYRQYGNAPPRILDKAIRLVLGRLGVYLEEFGYNVKTSVTIGSFGFNIWIEFDTAGNYPLPKGRPYYPFSVNWSEAMRNTIQKYDELYGVAKGLRQELVNLQLRKKAQQAQKLWDMS